LEHWTELTTPNTFVKKITKKNYVQITYNTKINMKCETEFDENCICSTYNDPDWEKKLTTNINK